jgi:precorrin-6B methylase 2
MPQGPSQPDGSSPGASRSAAERLSLADIRNQFRTLAIAERFFDSAVLFALYELGVFELLAGGPLDLPELTRRTGGNRDTLEAVLDAAVALGILSRSDGRYGADEALIECLGRGDSSAYMGEWVAFLHSLAGPLLALDDAVRTGRPPGALFEQMSGDSLPARRMTRAMDAYARTRGVELVDLLDLSDLETLLDLGCGPGTYSLAVLERYPRVRATLLDLELPIAEARRMVEARGLGDRAELVVADALDYRSDTPFDAVLISNTLHTLGPQRSRRLLRRCRDLVRPGGRLIVQAQFLNDDRISPRWPTLLSMIQRVTTPEGRNHSLGETVAWIEEAGFGDVEHVRFSAWNTNSALVARRPSETS